MGATTIRVYANTCSDPKLAEQDRETYDRRLQKLAAACGYKAGPFVATTAAKITSTLERVA